MQRFVLYIVLSVLLYPLTSFSEPGALDISFAKNGEGKYTIPQEKTESSGDFSVVQPDGEIIIGGTMGNLLTLMRISADGTTDNSFGMDGKVIERRNDYDSYLNKTFLIRFIKQQQLITLYRKHIHQQKLL